LQEPALTAAVLVIGVVVLLNMVLTLAIVRKVNAGDGSVMGGQIMERGRRPPDFSANLLDGSPSSLRDYTSRPTVFVFASPTCRPCLDSMPTYAHLAKVAPRVGAELVIVSDGERDETKRMLEQHGIDCRTIIAPRAANPLMQQWNVTGTPSFVHLEKGVVRSSGPTSPNVRVWQQILKWLDPESTTPQSESALV
jgi:peroxiredoxin